jgi:hypothetical protein
MAGNAYLSAFEQAKLGGGKSDMCENGTIVLKNGGGVKGNYFLISVMNRTRPGTYA